MTNAIEIKKLTVSYSKLEAIHDISLNIEKGDFVSVIGPNGGGKTTLINTILGFLKPISGEIKCNSTAISYVPQAANVDRDFPITVEEVVLTAFLKKGLNLFKRYTAEEKQKALNYLSVLGLKAYAKRKISELSGGEFQRLLIARALASSPEILLLDEPTSNVDTASKNTIFKVLKELNSNGITVIAVTHDLSAACSLSNKIAVINRSLIYYGEPIELQMLSQMLYEGEADNA